MKIDVFLKKKKKSVNVAFKFKETRERKFGKKEIKASILIGVIIALGGRGPNTRACSYTDQLDS
jgi:hypothetical protein